MLQNTKFSAASETKMPEQHAYHQADKSNRSEIPTGLSPSCEQKSLQWSASISNNKKWEYFMFKLFLFMFWLLIFTQLSFWGCQWVEDFPLLKCMSVHSYVYLIFHNFYYNSLADAGFVVGVIPVTSVNSCYKLVCLEAGWVICAVFTVWVQMRPFFVPLCVVSVISPSIQWQARPSEGL